MNVYVCIPCMDTVDTQFAQRLLSLRIPAGNNWTYDFAGGSLVYDARNQLAKRAAESDADRILWIDTDMIVPENLPDLLEDDKEKDIVTGLYFTRRFPMRPVIYSDIYLERHEDGTARPVAVETCPEEMTRIAGAGFGCVSMKRDIMCRIIEKYPLPFSPLTGFGEDLSFFIRAQALNIETWCDPRISCGHAGRFVYDENVYRAMVSSAETR